MNELHRDGAFAYTGCDALHRAMAHVTDGEDAGHAGLEQKRIAIQGPALGQLAIVDEIGTGEDETKLIALHDSGEPVGAGKRADKDEERVCRYTLGLAAIRAEHGDLFKADVAVNLRDAGVSPD